MICTFAMIDKISHYMFKRHYLKNRKYFLNFLLHFCNLHKNIRILKKNISYIV